MRAIFANKKITFGLVSATIVLIVLVCIMLTFFVQLSTFNAKAEMLKAEITSIIDKINASKEEIEHIKSMEYVYEWAKLNNLLTADQIEWWENN
ncbi:MAG: hypothetical protein RR086_05945 [Clostridia bacterium]